MEASSEQGPICKEPPVKARLQALQLCPQLLPHMEILSIHCHWLDQLQAPQHDQPTNDQYTGPDYPSSTHIRKTLQTTFNATNQMFSAPNLML